MTEDETEQFGVRESIVGYPLIRVGGASRFRPVGWVVETSFTDEPNDGKAAMQALQELDSVVAALRILGDQFFDYPVAAVTYQPYTFPSYAEANLRAPAFHRLVATRRPLSPDGSRHPLRYNIRTEVTPDHGGSYRQRNQDLCVQAQTSFDTR